MNFDHDVVIVGAGPVGLLLAIELTLAGVRPLVVDRLRVPSAAMKAMGLGTLGAEALGRRGLASAIDAEEARTYTAIQRYVGQPGGATRGAGSKIVGHFAGLSLIRKDAQREPERRPRAVDQRGLEAMLADRARALGIAVRRGCEVSALVPDADGVEVAWTSTAGDERTRCAWLVGCDGGHSFVRKAAGFAFPGTPPTLTFLQAMAEIDHPERLGPIGWNRTSTGVFSYGPMPGRVFLLDFSGPPADRRAPVTREELEATLRRISGQDVRVRSVDSASRWTDNTRMVDTYRLGRVLLAGDAAHVHTPFGGQGLNLGLVDAANLGWKLAAVIQGTMPERLIDSYTDERRPIAAAVLENNRAQVALLRPDPQSGALRDLMAGLMQSDDVNRRIGEMMSGLSTRYDLDADDDRVGRIAGDRPVGDATLHGLMQDGAGLLVDASGRTADATTIPPTKLHLRHVAVDTGPSMLIRPDGCVAWVGDGRDRAGLADAMHRWFGRPLTPSPIA